jgi:hypothetical protein
LVSCRGEKTAQVLESNLTDLEKKIDDLLASFEESERRMVEEAKGKKELDAKPGPKNEGPQNETPRAEEGKP